MARFAAVLRDWLERRLHAMQQPVSRAWRVGRPLLMLGLTFGLVMVPWPLQAGVARWWAPAILVTLAVLALGGGTLLGRVVQAALGGEAQLQLWGGSVRLPTGLARGAGQFTTQLLRRLGVALPALAFFCVWALVYISVWAWDPGACPVNPDQACQGAFGGLGEQPRLGQFVYLAAGLAFASPVPDLLARSSLAHALMTVEFLSGVSLATVYASRFLATPYSGGAPSAVTTAEDEADSEEETGSTAT